ncbi:MAG: hypothetical protein JWM68_951 [Verrucomicrobiales bacterium]|nr:hypothetical protein [Verrucomicrobiales bacterium]
MKITLACLICALAGAASAHPGHTLEMELAQHFSGDQKEQTTNATNEVSIKIQGDVRVISANGIPNHQPGQFPNRNNPNRIAPQHYTFSVPLNPKIAANVTTLRMQPFGVAVNGVVFDPFAAEWWDDDRSSMWQYEPMNMRGRLGADESNAHVQPNGSYHYHSVPTGLITKLSGGKSQMTLVGWAADGFPMYGPLGYSDAKKTNSVVKKLKSSYQVKKGVRPSGPGGNYDGTFVADYEFVKSTGDLDECNGRFGITPEFPQGTYYYVLTDDFPFIPRFFKGTPDQSFARKGPPGRGGPGGPGGPGGRPNGGSPENPDQPRPPRRADMDEDPSGQPRKQPHNNNRGSVHEASMHRSANGKS